ncbi:MAG: CHC2 zinc finger domain-containing protein [Anaerotignum sp.]|nr:CHC2 zinc finger domain-containing protein [Anaerotignum sp.]
MIDLFNEIKRVLTMREVAQKYGFEIDRKGWIVCPLHNDHKPSLKLYPNDRGWYCFACGIGGSVIDFVSHVFKLSAIEAAKKLNDDFSLGLYNEHSTSLQRQWSGHERLMQQRNLEKQEQKRFEAEMRLFALIDEENYLKEIYSSLPEHEKGYALGWLEDLNYQILSMEV